MSFELVHTSVQKGLRGSSGFATAVATAGLPNGLEQALEELSAYDFEPSRAIGADRVDWAHRIVTAQGRSYSVLSRTTPCGSDWSGRPNRVAHFVVLDASERAQAGPAWMLANLRGLADAPPAVESRAAGPSVPSGSVSPRAASRWIAAGFDAGWAGVVARTLLEAPSDACYLVLPADTDALPLVEDVLALMPDDRRWMVSFSTRFLRASANARCQLRCVREGSPGLHKLLAEPGARQVVVRAGASAGESAVADAGRNGTAVVVAARASTAVQPVLRDAGASEANAARTPQPAAPREWSPQPQAAPVADFHAPLDFPRDRLPAQSSNTLAYALFAVAGLALTASLVLVILMMLRA